MSVMREVIGMIEVWLSILARRCAWERLSFSWNEVDRLLSFVRLNGDLLLTESNSNELMHEL